MTLPHYANIRSGSMYRGDDSPAITGPRVIIFVAAAITGAVLGILTAPDVAVMPSGPGFEICEGRC